MFKNISANKLPILKTVLFSKKKNYSESSKLQNLKCSRALEIRSKYLLPFTNLSFMK